MNFVKKCNLRHWEFIFVALFLLISVIFIGIRGDDIYIQVLDNLDSNIVWEKMLQDNDLYFEVDGSVPFLGGVSRNNFSSEFKCYTWLYMLFSPFLALVIGWFLKICMSIAGFMLLGKLIWPEYESRKGMVVFCGFLYGILPTFPTSAFAFASLPLLLWMLVKLYRSADARWLIAVFFYPLLSSATVFGIFACGYIFVFFVADWIVKKKPAWRMLIAAFLLGIGYMVTEWRLFYSMLFSGVESVRSTFQTDYYSFGETIFQIAYGFALGQLHCGARHTFVILPACGIYFLYLNIGYLKRKEYKKIFSDVFNWLMIWILFNSIMFGIDNTQWFRSFIAKVLPPLSGFSFARTLWFNPFLWLFSFMLVLFKVSNKLLKNGLLVLAFGVLCVVPGVYNTLNYNLDMITTEVVTGQRGQDLTYREFYSTALFDEIKEDIGYDGEWSVAFGMHPAVLQYNTIATLDGYSSIYPAEYYTQFKKLIAPYLEDGRHYADYFNSWGARTYVFTDEVSFEPYRHLDTDEAQLKIDPEVFRQMDGTYVFSRVAVSNAQELGFSQIGVYTHEDSPYTIYVYQLESREGA